MSNCRLQGVDFDYSILNRANLFRSDFAGAYIGRADFSNAQLEASFKKAIATGTKFDGANLADAGEGVRMPLASFQGSNLCGASFDGALVSFAKFDGAKLSEPYARSGQQISGGSEDCLRRKLTGAAGTQKNRHWSLHIFSFHVLLRKNEIHLPRIRAKGTKPKNGAYLLRIRLDTPLNISLRRGAIRGVLASGAYVYAGNAYGSGGLEARVRRHLDKTKKPHWHVDQVTTRAAEVTADLFPGGQECDLIATLLASGDYAVPIPRFGSSDCRVCPSHFLRYVGD